MCKLFSVVLAIMVGLSYANPAHAGLKGIAALDSSKGRVMVKSLGSWGVAHQEGMGFYVGDKIVTKKKAPPVSFSMTTLFWT